MVNYTNLYTLYLTDQRIVLWWFDAFSFQVLTLDILINMILLMMWHPSTWIQTWFHCEYNVCLLACLFVCLSVRLSIRSSFCSLFVHSAIHSFTHAFIHPSILPSIHPSIHYYSFFLFSFIYSFFCHFVSASEIKPVSWKSLPKVCITPVLPQPYCGII
jgi:hypothetical protein